MKHLVPQFATAAAVAALLAIGAGHASAQSSMSSPSGAGTTTQSAPGSIGPASQAARMKDPLSSEDITQIDGTSVAAGDGSSIGKVSTVLMNPSTKKVDRLVVAEGGVLGVGAHNVALPVEAFRWDAQNRNFVIQKTADDLKAMPEWQRPQLAEAPSAAAAPSGNPSIGIGVPAGGASAPMTRTSSDTSDQPAH